MHTILNNIEEMRNEFNNMNIMSQHRNPNVRSNVRSSLTVSDVLSEMINTID